jgi:hypothetical protein
MHLSIHKTCGRLAAIVIPLMAFQATASEPATERGSDIQIAKVTLKKGMPPERLEEYEPAVSAACGELGMVANSPTSNAQIIGGWSDDQYTNQSDPKAGKKYGDHLTIETFVGSNRTGRWHLYESGSVWVDRAGSIKESCHA